MNEKQNGQRLLTLLRRLQPLSKHVEFYVSLFGPVFLGPILPCLGRGLGLLLRTRNGFCSEEARAHSRQERPSRRLKVGIFHSASIEPIRNARKQFGDRRRESLSLWERAG